jgi:hypothetical protein
MKNVNLIIAVGSVDGIATTAAVMNFIGTTVPVIFTQAFTVDQLKPEEWESGRRIAFVDLAVNNRDAEMTKAFVEKVYSEGHEIVAVIDEHDSKAWQQVLGKRFEYLQIKPKSQDEGECKSSGAVLLKALDNQISDHAKLLCEAADNGDSMKFEGIAKIINSTVKSNIQDNNRRVELANCFAFNAEPNQQITDWLSEYEEILKNNQEVIDAGTEVTEGIIRVNATGKKIDMTSLMAELYKSYRIVVLEGMAYNKEEGKPTLQVSFGTNDKSLNLLTVVEDAEIPFLGGFAQKVNILPEHEDAALRAIISKMAIKKTRGSYHPEITDYSMIKCPSCGKIVGMFGIANLEGDMTLHCVSVQAIHYCTKCKRAVSTVALC